MTSIKPSKLIMSPRLFLPAFCFILMGLNVIPAQALPADVAELIQQDKFPEAMVRVEALLKEKPEDAELKQTQQELAGLLAPRSQVPAKTTPDALSPMENAEIRMLLKDLSQAKDDDRTRYMRELMKTTAELLKKHPDQTSVWALRGMGALELNDEAAGMEARKNLLRLGADQSHDPNTLEVVVGLKRKVWHIPNHRLAEGEGDANNRASSGAQYSEADLDEQLNVVYKQLRANLTDSQKQTLKQEELGWIKVRDGFPEGSAARSDCLQRRIQELQSRLSNGSNQAINSLSSEEVLDEQLNVVYKGLRAKLNSAQKENLKQEELRWLQQRDAYPHGSTSRLEYIRRRIQELRSRL